MPKTKWWGQSLPSPWKQLKTQIYKTTLHEALAISRRGAVIHEKWETKTRAPAYWLQRSARCGTGRLPRWQCAVESLGNRQLEFEGWNTRAWKKESPRAHTVSSEWHLRTKQLCKWRNHAKPGEQWKRTSAICPAYTEHWESYLFPPARLGKAATQGMD